MAQERESRSSTVRSVVRSMANCPCPRYWTPTHFQCIHQRLIAALQYNCQSMTCLQCVCLCACVSKGQWMSNWSPCNMILSQKMLKKILAISVSTRQNNNQQSKHWLIKTGHSWFSWFCNLFSAYCIEVSPVMLCFYYIRTICHIGPNKVLRIKS